MIKQLMKLAYRFARRGVHRVRDAALRSEFVYRGYLQTLCGVQFPPPATPKPVMAQGALKSKQEWQTALAQVQSLHLPRHPDSPKNWDTLAAVAQVLADCSPQARVLDAGAELYSSFLPALYAYGYRHLTGINLAFPRCVQRGPIRYEPGDITQTRFADGYFDAAACLSVVEHGVNLRDFFKEMARIIKPHGLLLVSTDYWETPIDTTGKSDFGAPIHVFNREELEIALQFARECGLELIVPVDWDCVEKPVRWDYHGLQYTYVLLMFRRTTLHEASSLDEGLQAAPEHSSLANPSLTVA
jgi:SAM-dependent methyltransferase